MYPSHEFCRKNTTTKIERASFQSFIPLYFTIYNTGFSMTGSSSQAIEIGGSRTERVDSDPSEDMSYIGTPMNVTSPANLTLHEANYQFGNPMPPVKEEDENDFPLLPGECRVKVDGANDWPIIGGTIIVTNYRFFGIASDRVPILLIIEFCNGGTLEQHLTKFNDEISFQERMIFIHDASAGLKYIQSMSITHRDILLVTV
ncbi:hypothetical protein L5515_004462 [Caenorhabditis briggsae]|uniref:Protein kinase domain-containing protein n=1 Tax=Caenorhabditis briggsae TaxID=6238 RepID=A0AAE9EMR4_CAEBR|nr:hypothetical protein L5515_004462 [Caenorhabditis briggsae]